MNDPIYKDPNAEFQQAIDQASKKIDLTNPEINAKFLKALNEETISYGKQTLETIIRQKETAQTAEDDAEIRRIAQETRAKFGNVPMAIAKYRDEHNLPAASELNQAELEQAVLDFSPEAVKRAVQRLKATQLSEGQSALKVGLRSRDG